MFRLSEYLTQQLDELDECIYTSLEKSNAAKEAERYTSHLVAEMINPLLAFEPGPVHPMWPDLLKRAPAAFAERLDECYTRQVLKLIPRLVKRTMKLSFIVPCNFPSGPTNVFLREAGRTYIFGFWQASVALSRAAVEQGLRDRLKDALGSGTAAKFHQLVRTAVEAGLLDKPHGQLANKVELAGNNVLHGKPSTDGQAWEALCAARGVLIQLFAAEAT